MVIFFRVKEERATALRLVEKEHPCEFFLLLLNTGRMCVNIFSFLALDSHFYSESHFSSKYITLFSAPCFSLPDRHLYKLIYVFFCSLITHFHIQYSQFVVLLKLPSSSGQLRIIFHDNSFIIDCL